MSPVRKLKRQVFAKKTVLGSITIAVLITLVALSSTLMIITPEPAKAAWWNNDWDYRKKCNVANPVADYQIRLNLSYDDTLDGGENVTLDSHAQTDFGDIRFTNAAEDTEYLIPISDSLRTL